MQRWELQILVGAKVDFTSGIRYVTGGEWETVGFWERGGFMPYRYEFREDAEEALRMLYPRMHREDRRVVPASSVCIEKESCIA